jgi:hypothetical protein
MSDIENGKTNGAAKDEKLGIVPISKLGAVVPSKVWDAHKKNLQALADAKAAEAF